MPLSREHEHDDAFEPTMGSGVLAGQVRWAGRAGGAGGTAVMRRMALADGAGVLAGLGRRTVGQGNR
jgi:hypothetical protein